MGNQTGGRRHDHQPIAQRNKTNHQKKQPFNSHQGRTYETKLSILSTRNECDSRLINKQTNGGDGSGNGDGANGSGRDDGVWIGFVNASPGVPSSTPQRPPRQTENGTLYTHTHAHLAMNREQQHHHRFENRPDTPWRDWRPPHIPTQRTRFPGKSPFRRVSPLSHVSRLRSCQRSRANDLPSCFYGINCLSMRHVVIPLIPSTTGCALASLSNHNTVSTPTLSSSSPLPLIALPSSLLQITPPSHSYPPYSIPPFRSSVNPSDPRPSTPLVDESNKQ